MFQKCIALLVLLNVGVLTVVAQNCILTVPPDALSAAGLATPWISENPLCVQTPMALGGTASFVQASIIDLDTGNMATYTPLILSRAAPNNVAAIAPVVPALPANHVVAIFGGTNGGSSTLNSTLSKVADTTTMQFMASGIQANCVNGGGSPFSGFGQFFCCNCNAWMNAAYNLIRAGLITTTANAAYNANQIPALKTITVNGISTTCPTTHSFAIVDQDQSDNVPAKYLFVTATGQLAQDTVPNRATLKGNKQAFIEFDNGSDNELVTLVQAALGCTVFNVTDLADATGQTKFPTSLTNQLQALTLELMPRAFVPVTDPMVLNAGLPDINKLNAYRVAVGQTALQSVNEADVAVYCNNLYVVGAPQIASWLPALVHVTAPDFGIGVAATLGGLLVARFGVTVNAPGNGGMLNCPSFTGLPNPFHAFTGVGVPNGTLICPAPFANLQCAFTPTAGTTASLTGIKTALGVANLVPNNLGQQTFDIPFAPASNVAGVLAAV